MNEIQLKEYSRDVDYIKELLKLWEKTALQSKSNILYEFYFYKNKFEDIIEYSKEYKIDDKLIIEELKVVLQALNILIDSLTEKEVQQIYNKRSKEKSKTEKLDKLKYNRSEEQKFNGSIKRKENHIKRTPSTTFYLKNALIKLVVYAICLFILTTGVPERIIDYNSQVMYNVQYNTEKEVSGTSEIQNIIEPPQNISDMKHNIKVSTDGYMKVYELFIKLAIIVVITLLSIKLALDIIIVIYPNIVLIFKNDIKDKFVSEEAKEAIKLSEESKHEVEVETEIKKSDKISMAEELVEVLKNNYKEHKEILNNTRSLSVGLSSKKYKERYNSSSKIENYYNYLLKTEDR